MQLLNNQECWKVLQVQIPAEPPSLTFNWLVPNVTNGVILDYSLTCVSEGIPTPPSVTSTTTSATISNLENGLRYCCTVTARNAQGDSMPSEQQCISTIEIGKITCCRYYCVLTTIMYHCSQLQLESLKDL